MKNVSGEPEEEDYEEGRAEAPIRDYVNKIEGRDVHVASYQVCQWSYPLNKSTKKATS